MLTIDYILVVYFRYFIPEYYDCFIYTTPIHGKGGPGTGAAGGGTGINPLNTPVILRRCSAYAAIRAVIKTLNAVS
jgi:hypothetical protein